MRNNAQTGGVPAVSGERLLRALASSGQRVVGAGVVPETHPRTRLMMVMTGNDSTVEVNVTSRAS